MSRSSGRVYDLRRRVVERLNNHDPLVQLLEVVVDDASDVIVPKTRNLRWYNDDDTLQREPPEAALAVSVVTSSSDRENAQERKFFAVQTETELAFNADKSLADENYGMTPWFDQIRDEVSAVMTAHDDGWTAQGETGGTPEPLTRQDRNRYAVVQRFNVMKFGK